MTAYGFPTTTSAAPAYQCELPSGLAEGLCTICVGLSFIPPPTLESTVGSDYTLNVNSYLLKFTDQAPPYIVAGAKMVQATVSAVILAAFTTLY